MTNEKGKKVKKPRRLSQKQKGFAREVALGESGTQAVLKHYDVTDPKVAAVIASENLNKPNVQEEIENVKVKYADRLPEDLLIKAHLEGLNATQVRFTPEGERIEVPDYSTRHKYLDTGLKVKKEYGDTEPPKPPATQTYNFIFSAEVQSEVKALEERIKERLTQKHAST